ncbi:MAG: flippase-like domain-containing protein [Oligoflexia bacterium]|nr:flippase-like domain-containing protein [Oligoflexia bacterium]MBF0367307.1 flippase-like domain-containing protein [Oligoflexia bacterium]
MIKFLIKLSIAVALVYWLFQSGKIDFSILQDSFVAHKSHWVIAFAITCMALFLVAIRWKKILEAKSSKKFNYFDILRLTWIGNLFNTVLPGAVSGDFVKLIYARKIDPNLSKTFLLTSVFMDRILGLFGLLFLMGIASIIKYSELTAISPALANLIHLNFMIFAGMLLFILSLFLPQRFQQSVFNLGNKIPFLGKQFNKTLAQFWIIGKNKKNVIFLILLSMFTQMMNNLIFWTLASPFFEYAANAPRSITILDGLTFIPLGFVAVAIPITPSGIGVGHLAFNTLFSYYGVTNGASLFNFFLMVTIIVNLMGVIPYLTHRRELSDAKKEMENGALDDTSELGSTQTG